MKGTFTARFKAAARAAGADLVGIAPIGRFNGIAKSHHPSSIFPETRSVVVIGKRIVRGCLRGVEEGTQFSLYNTYAMNWLPHRFLAMVTVSAATFLEDNGSEAVPLPDLPTQVPAMGVAVKPDAPAPNVMIDFADAAVRAGLGEIGYTGELMTPEFGHLQRIQIILTDTELEPDPICEQEICDRCGACVSACPLGAISESPGSKIEICGRRMEIAEVDAEICSQCKNGAWANPSHSSGRPDRLAAACMRACIAHLEEKGCLANRFHAPFRKRPAWKIDHSGVASVEKGAGL